MKYLYLLRHAKSSWKDLSVNDFDRPLNKRGKKDAPNMGKFLNDRNVKVDLIISSPAKRTKETSKIIAEGIGYKNKIIFDKNIYEASLEQLLALIKNLNKNLNSVMLVAHNPGLTELANYFVNEDIDNIPTCGIAAIILENGWDEVKRNCGKLLFFEYPKKLNQ